MSEKRPAIAIASDHAGYFLKELIKGFLRKNYYEVTDYGTDSEERADYADHVHPLARAIEEGKHEKGVIICGSGNGVSITANKHQGIRAALSWTQETARLARAHNDANVLALPARFIDEETAMECVLLFLNTPFEGGRHVERVQKIRIK